MRRVAVVGCPGSGKTTVAEALAATLGCDHIELDSIFHQRGWVPLDAEEFARRVREITQRALWVIDGNYSSVRDLVWDQADTVVWLDLPFVLVMSRVILRTVRRVINRAELWNGNREPLSNLWSLNPEKSIIMWAATRHRLYRQRYGDAVKDPRWSAVAFVQLKSERAVLQFLHGVTAESSAREGWSRS